MYQDIGINYPGLQQSGQFAEAALWLTIFAEKYQESLKPGNPPLDFGTVDSEWQQRIDFGNQYLSRFVITKNCQHYKSALSTAIDDCDINGLDSLFVSGDFERVS